MIQPNWLSQILFNVMFGRQADCFNRSFFTMSFAGFSGFVQYTLGRGNIPVLACLSVLMFNHEQCGVINLQDCKDCLHQAAVSHSDVSMTEAVVLGFSSTQLQCNFLSLAAAAVPQNCVPTTSVGCRLFGSPTQESMFVQDKIIACPHNESSWNYLRGLLSLPDMKQALVLQELAAFCVKVSTAYCWMLVVATVCRSLCDNVFVLLPSTAQDSHSFTVTVLVLTDDCH